MPNQTNEGKVQLIIKLSENVTAKYDFVYGKDPVLNHPFWSTTFVRYAAYKYKFICIMLQ